MGDMLIPDYTDLHNAHKHIIHDTDQSKQALHGSKVKDVHNVNEGKGRNLWGVSIRENGKEE